MPAAAELRRHALRLARLQRTVARQANAQDLAVDELGGDEVAAVSLAHLVDGEDAGVIESGSGLRLEPEAAETLLVAVSSRGNSLSDAPAEDLVLGEVDLSHSAGAELLEDAVVGEGP
jgi:hypothetical protein